MPSTTILAFVGLTLYSTHVRTAPKRTVEDYVVPMTTLTDTRASEVK